MSSTIVVPPPNSSSVARTVPRLTARARALLTAMNLHFAAVAALLVLVLWLLVRVFVLWGGLKSNDDAAMAQQQATLRAAEIASLPIKGLDAKVAKSTEEADDFYADRFPYATSQFVAELGALTKRANVRLSRVAYTYTPPQLRGDATITEVRIDASITGDYRPVMEFINSLERDNMFFLIGSITLSGQQTGQVSLRLRMSTYLRQPEGEEVAIAAAANASEASQAPVEGATP